MMTPSMRIKMKEKVKKNSSSRREIAGIRSQVLGVRAQERRRGGE
jgi:hypothetical protein